jgi:phosphatidylglycerophosphate synthase
MDYIVDYVWVSTYLMLSQFTVSKATGCFLILLLECASSIYRRHMSTNQHTAFIVLDMIYFTAGTKATPASIFGFVWIPLLHNVVERGRNRTARFRCVFGSTDGHRI